MYQDEAKIPSEDAISSEMRKRQRVEPTSQEPIIISAYLQKGGVGKTTSVHELSNTFAKNTGEKVLMVDADPQCNLTAITLRDDPEYKGSQEFEFLKKILDGPRSFAFKNLKPVEFEKLTACFLSHSATLSEEQKKIFKKFRNLTGGYKQLEFTAKEVVMIQGFLMENNQPELSVKLLAPPDDIQNILQCFQDVINNSLASLDFEKVKNVKLRKPHYGNGRVFLLPGHPEFNRLEEFMAHSLSGTESGPQAAFLSLPGQVLKFIRDIAKQHGIRYIFMDLNPSASATNQLLLMGSDYFYTPIHPDYFSFQAVESMTNFFPRWNSSIGQKFRANSRIPEAFRMPPPPKYMGEIFQRFKVGRIQDFTPTKPYQEIIDQITQKIENDFLPMLAEQGMVAPHFVTVCGRIPAFLSLGAEVQNTGKPISSRREFTRPRMLDEAEGESHYVETREKPTKIAKGYARIVQAFMQNMIPAHRPNTVYPYPDIPHPLLVNTHGGVEGVEKVRKLTLGGRPFYGVIYHTTGDGNCGFYALPIPYDREGACDLLIENKDNAETRRWVAKEIKELLIEGRLNQTFRTRHHAILNDVNKTLHEDDQRFKDTTPNIRERLGADGVNGTYAEILERAKNLPRKTREIEKEIEQLEAFVVEEERHRSSIENDILSQVNVFEDFVTLHLREASNYLGFSTGAMNPGRGELEQPALPEHNRNQGVLEAILRLMNPPIRLSIWQDQPTSGEGNNSSVLRCVYSFGPADAAPHYLYFNGTNHFSLMSVEERMPEIEEGYLLERAVTPSFNESASAGSPSSRTSPTPFSSQLLDRGGRVDSERESLISGAVRV